VYFSTVPVIAIFIAYVLQKKIFFKNFYANTAIVCSAGNWASTTRYRKNIDGGLVLKFTVG